MTHDKRFSYVRILPGGMLPLLVVFFFWVSLMSFSKPVYAQFDPDRFGPPAPSVAAEVNYNENLILFNFYLDESYHITDLKNGFFTIQVEKNDYLAITNTNFPAGVPYGQEKVFKGKFSVKVFLKTLKEITAPIKLKFTVSYQICQEKPQESCYPPEDKVVEVAVDKNFTKADNRARKAGESYMQWTERIIKQELKNKSFLLFFLVFLAGFLTSLTPCVYPVIPIVMGYIGTRSGNKKLKGFYLSIFFVLGLAVVYSVFGVIAATTGTMMGVSFQNPIVVVVIATIFIVMGLSMAGFFDIPVPSSISSKMQAGHKSEIIGSLVVGGISGIIAAPCVGPVLIALLSWISQTGNILLGFWLTFTFSMGMGIIFLLVGTFSGLLSAMPKGGQWMTYIKYFFAIVLLGGGIYFLGTIAAPWLNLVIWGVFLLSASIFMGLFKPAEEDEEHKQKLFRVLLVLLFLLGALLFVKGIEQHYFPASAGTVAATTEHKSDLPWLKNLEEGRNKAKSENKMMMIDTYADWCVACKELDEQTFSVPEVAERLKTFTLVKLDFTKKDGANEELRKSLNVIGMPTVIFFNPDGTEIKRFSGFLKKDEFLAVLDSLK